MATENDWIAVRIAEARISNPLATEAVSVRLHALLKGSLSEDHHTPAELASVARALIDDMVPPG